MSINKIEMVTLQYKTEIIVYIIIHKTIFFYPFKYFSILFAMIISLMTLECEGIPISGKPIVDI